MAVLAVASRSARIPAGPYWMQSFITTTTAGAQDDEWIVTGFENVVAVLGDAVIGATAGTETNNYEKNQEGTAAAATAGFGLLGIETQAALTVEVTVLGN